MRRLLAWGRQDPQCPAEAASPPPLSAFHSPCSVFSPTPSKLFSDIERQLSARIAAEPLLLRSARQQPSPPTEAANERTIPPEPTPVLPAATTAASKNAATATADSIQTQQQQQRQRVQGTAATHATIGGHQPQQQPKGIDAFFAALANASRDNGGGPWSPTASSSVSYQQMPLLEPEQPDSRCNSFAQQPPIVPRLLSSELCAPQQLITQQLSAQPLAQKIHQQVTNTALSTNLLVTALAAQQQCQQQQNERPSIDPSMALLANLKASSNQSAAPLPPMTQFNCQLDVQRHANIPNSSIGGPAALNAYQLVQQTAQFNQQKMMAEQQQLNSTTTLAMKSPLSPQNAVFACSEIGIPALLSRLSSVPTIFRSVDPGSSQSKPIPLLDERVDLLQFKRKEPREWCSDDVVAWILNVARRHQIPCENLNLAKFANCTGPLLMLMNEQSFKEHDPNYGSLLYSEFCKLVTDEDFIDEWMKMNGAVAGSSSATNQPLSAQMNLKKPAVPTNFLQQTTLLGQLAIQQEKRQQQRLLLADSVTGAEQPMDATTSLAEGSTSAGLLLSAVAANSQQQQGVATNCALSSLNQLLLPATSAAERILHQQQNKPQASPVGPLQPPPLVGQSMAIASLSRMIPPTQQRHQQEEASTANGTGAVLIGTHRHHLSGTSNVIIAHQQRSHQQLTLKPIAMEGTKRGVGRPAGSKNKVEKQIKRNKDGRPRKRSQHTKGNKLWEFIRDALKDSRTCPSVVRWEDPSEGVFRIVESERLAFLWGQKKNNQKMTYEKLSRAMRTYYEKEILVPVPKSGLYPKKLVYKFGPTAHGWRAAAALAVQAHLALIGGPSINMRG